MSISRITTHVLDATTGRPAAGVAVELLGRAGVAWSRSRTASPTPTAGLAARAPSELPAGEYRLRFDTGAYFAARGGRPFYPEVVLTVLVADDGRHVHAPLLLSPFAYSTYRGS